MNEKRLNKKNIFAFLRTFLDGNFYLRRQSLKRINKYLNGNLIEIGVGQGPDMDYFKSLDSIKEYTGCDRREYHGTYSKGYLPKEIILYKGTRLPFKNDVFDTAISVDCFEHMRYEEIKPFFTEAYRILKNNGILIISAPFIYPEHSIPYDYFRYIRYGLKELANKFDFKLIKEISRSSTIETFLVNLNHRIYFYFMPNYIAKEFGENKRDTESINIVKFLIFPFTAIVYMAILSLILVISSLPVNREKSNFTLGFTCIFKKS